MKKVEHLLAIDSCLNDPGFPSVTPIEKTRFSWKIAMHGTSFFIRLVFPGQLSRMGPADETVETDEMRASDQASGSNSRVVGAERKEKKKKSSNAKLQEKHGFQTVSESIVSQK